MHPALIYLPGDRLSLTELTAARLDGHVVEVGEGYLPADTVEGADARALSLRHLLAAGCAVSGPSAAWVHGAGDGPPPRHHICRVDAGAPRPRHSSRVKVHDLSLRREDVIEICGIPVLVPLAVVIELAVGAARDPEYRRWLHALVSVFPGLAGSAQIALAERKRVPGKRAALELIVELAGHDVVTR